MPALGQIVSGNKKDNTHEKTAPVDEVKRGVQRITVDQCGAPERNQWTNAQDQTINFGTDVLFLWIETCHYGTEYVHKQAEYINTDDSKSFTAVSVRCTVEVKMRGNLVRQTIPQEETQEHGQNRDDTGYEEKFSIFFRNRKSLLSGLTARAILLLRPKYSVCNKYSSFLLLKNKAGFL